MTKDRRGFQYALEPVRQVTNWELDEISGAVAALHREVQTQQDALDQLRLALAALRQDLLAQRQSQALLDIDVQRNAHQYQMYLQAQIKTATADLAELEQKRDAEISRLNEKRRFADNLERDKEAAAQEHDQVVRNRQFQETDENWLQRQHAKQPNP